MTEGVWWTITNDEEAESRCNEISSVIMDIAFPKIKTLAFAETFVRLWQSGKGHGLTEYERRLGLVKLLTALGRKSDAQQALDAFEAASMGKAWAASATVDLRELNKHLR